MRLITSSALIPGSNRSFWDLKPSSQKHRPRRAERFKPFLLGFEIRSLSETPLVETEVQTVPSGI